MLCIAVCKLHSFVETTNIKIFTFAESKNYHWSNPTKLLRCETDRQSDIFGSIQSLSIKKQNQTTNFMGKSKIVQKCVVL